MENQAKSASPEKVAHLKQLLKEKAFAFFENFETDRSFEDQVDKLSGIKPLQVLVLRMMSKLNDNCVEKLFKSKLTKEELELAYKQAISE